MSFTCDNLKFWELYRRVSYRLNEWNNPDWHNLDPESFRDSYEDELSRALDVFADYSEFCDKLPKSGGKPISGLKTIRNICHQVINSKDNEPQENDRKSKTDIPDYKALNLANRTITIGTRPYNITSEKVWDFLKELCSALRDDRLVPGLEGATNNKNNVDRLRKQIGNDNLHKLIIFVNGGYNLNSEVKILHGGQIGIRKTHVSHKKK